MRHFENVACWAALLCLAVPAGFAKTPAAAKGGSGRLVIVFKDGRRESFNLADISRVEFPGATAAATAEDAGPPDLMLPTRGRFLGKWEVGEGNGDTFFITLNENGDAWRSLGDVHGKWAYVDGEARVTWDDGAKDAIRKVGGKFEKFAYGDGKSFTDTPDNVTNARNMTPHPI